MDPLYIPLLYLSEESLFTVVSLALRRIWIRDEGQIIREPDNSGHLVIGGVEGVGKSTFMKAIALTVFMKPPACHDTMMTSSHRCRRLPSMLTVALFSSSLHSLLSTVLFLLWEM